jgi:hypothetical protein
MSMKNSKDTIGNRTRDLPACSAVPQPTAPPGVPNKICNDRSFGKGHLLDLQPLDMLPLTTDSINGCVINTKGEKPLFYTHCYSLSRLS